MIRAGQSLHCAHTLISALLTFHFRFNARQKEAYSQSNRGEFPLGEVTDDDQIVREFSAN